MKTEMLTLVKIKYDITGTPTKMKSPQYFNIL